MKVYPLLAFLIVSNALWEKLLHNQIGLAFRRILEDVTGKPAFLSQYFSAYETLRWNALAGWAIGLFLLVLTARDPKQKGWVTYGLALYCAVALLVCILPD